MSIKHYNKSTWNRTRNFPVCSAVPELTAPPRTPYTPRRISKLVAELWHLTQLCAVECSSNHTPCFAKVQFNLLSTYGFILQSVCVSPSPHVFIRYTTHLAHAFEIPLPNKPVIIAKYYQISSASDVSLHNIYNSFSPSLCLSVSLPLYVSSAMHSLVLRRSLFIM